MKKPAWRGAKNIGVRMRHTLQFQRQRLRRWMRRHGQGFAGPAFYGRTPTNHRQGGKGCQCGFACAAMIQKTWARVASRWQRADPSQEERQPAAAGAGLSSTLWGGRGDVASARRSHTESRGRQDVASERGHVVKTANRLQGTKISQGGELLSSFAREAKSVPHALSACCCHRNPVRGQSLSWRNGYQTRR